MIERKVYQCEHCKVFKRTPKLLLSRRDMYLHEYHCLYNRENKTCLTCKHNDYGRYDREWDTQVNDCELKVDKGNLSTNAKEIMSQCEQWEGL